MDDEQTGDDVLGAYDLLDDVDTISDANSWMETIFQDPVATVINQFMEESVQFIAEDMLGLDE